MDKTNENEKYYKYNSSLPRGISINRKKYTKSKCIIKNNVRVDKELNVVNIKNKNIINKRYSNHSYYNLLERKISNIFPLFVYFIFLFLINLITNEKSNDIRYLNSDSIIYLSVVGIKDYQQIIFFNYTPDIVYLNGIESELDYGYIFINNYNINNVTLKWNEELESLEYIFSGIYSIIEIDFSNFDSSKVTLMTSMFELCSNLKYINFDNFNTSSVIDMSSMFENCESLVSINLSNFDTSKVTSMDNMFINCYSLISLDLSFFDTQKLLSMTSMFDSCISLTEINFSNFDTSKVNYMEYLFSYCSSLTSLDITSFDTRNTKLMYYMFCDCSSLTSLDLSSFNTKNVEDMEGMFYLSSSLEYLDLSNFDISSVYILDFMFCDCYSLISVNFSNIVNDIASFNYMFYNCFSLEYIDFSNAYIVPFDFSFVFYQCNSLLSIDFWNFDFSACIDMEYLFYQCNSLTSIDFFYMDTSRVTSIQSMFYGCYSLKEIDLLSWDTFSLQNIESLFYDCFSLIYLDLSYFDTYSVTNMKNAFSNCIELTSINLEYFETSSTIDMQSMFYGCNSLLSLDLSSFNTSMVTSMKSMFFGCSKLYSLDLSNFNFESISNMASMFCGCSNLSYINVYNYDDELKPNVNGIFWDTSDNLIVIINNQANKNLIKNELNNLKCISSNFSITNFEDKNKKIIFETRACIDDCLNDEIYKYEYENFCYKDCPFGTYSLLNDSNLCKNKRVECSENYPYLNILDNSCIDYCFSEDFFKEKCILNSQNDENKKKHSLNLIKEIENGKMNELLLEVINESKDLIVYENNILYQITTSYNQNIKEYENISSLNLGEFEYEIKEHYNISQNDHLIILKIEEKVEGLLIPLIKYILFDSVKKEQLLLNFSNEKKIIGIYNPVKINESEEYKYNLNSNYYNSICFLVSIDGIDITLYDRKNIYYQNNMSLCQENCVYINYDYNNKKSICECEVTDDELLLYEKNNNNISFKRTVNIKRIINLNVMKCYKLLFTKEGLLQNIGNYIILIIIFVYIICSILFYEKGYDFLCSQINDILNIKNLENGIEINTDKENKNDKNSKENFSELVSNSKKSKVTANKNKSDMPTNMDISLSRDIINNEKNKEKFKIKNEQKNNYIECEINNFSYEEAKENDKRTYFEYYISLLKVNHLLFYVFNRNKDYNSNIIKVCLLFFSFAIYFVTNALFFNDSLMHIIYIDKGNYNLLYNIPIIIYATIISSIIMRIMRRLSLSQNNILEIKYEKNKYNIKAISLTVIKCIIIKYICFFIISILILLLFWLYLSSFCTVYKNTQKYLIKNTSLSYLISVIYSIIICFLPGIFRKCSFNNPGKYLYDISQIIQLF